MTFRWPILALEIPLLVAKQANIFAHEVVEAEPRVGVTNHEEAAPSRTLYANSVMDWIGP